MEKRGDFSTSARADKNKRGNGAVAPFPLRPLSFFLKRREKEKDRRSGLKL